jgi:hypothetical protein
LWSTGATTSTLLYLPWLALAYAQLVKSDEAWRSISEALALIEPHVGAAKAEEYQSNQRSTEAEVHRVAETSATSPAFQHALAVARQQQAKSNHPNSKREFTLAGQHRPSFTIGQAL